MNHVSELILTGRSERIELLPPEVENSAVGSAVCGFLNQQGGTVLIGVKRDGAAPGVDEAAERLAQLTRLLMESLVPRPLISLNIEVLRNRQFILIEIPAAQEKPYSFDNKIWIRLGTRNLQATPDQSAEIVQLRAAAALRWGRNPLPGFEIDDCDVDELATTRKEISAGGRFGVAVPADDEELLQKLYLTQGSQLTNAAMVLFASDPRIWSPNVAMRIVSFGEAGRSGKALHDQSLHGPAVRMLHQTVSIIQQHTGFSSRFKPSQIHREDRPAYAVYALREGLVNAIVHRDYQSRNGEILVEIHPDRLVISNPGTLPEGWTPEDILKREESHPANPDIARVFHLRGLMERLGLGGRRLAEECRGLKARSPVWDSQNGRVSLTLFKAPAPGTSVESLNPRVRFFLGSAKAGRAFKADYYARKTGITARQARRDLNEMVECGLATREGKGPSTAYQLTPGSVDQFQHQQNPDKIRTHPDTTTPPLESES